VGCENVDWIHLVRDRVAGSCEYSNKHSGFIKGWNFMTISATITFSRKTLLNGVIYDVTFVVLLRKKESVRKQFLENIRNQEE
jgi:hypothetical protein